MFCPRCYVVTKVSISINISAFPGHYRVRQCPRCKDLIETAELVSGPEQEGPCDEVIAHIQEEGRALRAMRKRRWVKRRNWSPDDWEGED